MSCSKVGEDLYLCSGKEKCSNTSTSIWGSNPYTSDCPPCQGARHSGVITDAGGFFKLISVGQIEKFVGTEANGITTSDYGSYSGVRVEAASSNPFQEGLITNCFGVGDYYYCKGEGCSSSGTLWGSNPYTYDSPMCQCARHAGFIRKGEMGFFKAEKLEDSPSAYEGTTANEITSSPYGSYRGVRLSGCDSNPFPGCEDCGGATGKFPEGEEVFTCVQCGQRYIEVENDILKNACSYHEVGRPSRRFSKSTVHACCHQKNPCRTGPHRPKHHSDYIYAAMGELVRDLACVDCGEWYGHAVDYELDRVEPEVELPKQEVKLFRIRRWLTGLKEISDELLWVQVGCYSMPNYYIRILNMNDMREIGEKGVEEIHRNSDSLTSYSYARWIIVDGVVQGAYLECRCHTSSQPDIVECRFTFNPLTLVSSSKLSDGGIIKNIPSGPYILPEPVRYGPVLEYKPTRPNRTKHFRSQGSLPLMTSVTPLPLRCRLARGSSHVRHEIVESNLVLVNTTREDNIAILKITCEFRMVGTKEWSPVDELEIDNPGTLAPYHAVTLPWKIHLYSKDIEQLKLPPERAMSVWDDSVIGRFQPVRFRFTINDVEGNVATRVFEHVHEPQKYRDHTNLATGHYQFFVDDMELLYRDTWTVILGSFKSVVGTASCGYNAFRLDAVAHAALQKGETEVLLIHENVTHASTQFPCMSDAKLYLLLDTNTNRFYAAKAVLSNRWSCYVHYLPIAMYGEPSVLAKTVENKPAVETSQLPVLEEYVPVNLPQDDDYDDVALEKKKAVGKSKKEIKLAPTTIADLQRLNESMDSIASSMDQFESIEKSITSLGESISIIVDSMSK